MPTILLWYRFNINLRIVRMSWRFTQTNIVTRTIRYLWNSSRKFNIPTILLWYRFNTNFTYREDVMTIYPNQYRYDDGYEIFQKFNIVMISLTSILVLIYVSRRCRNKSYPNRFRHEINTISMNYPKNPMSTLLL
jgi:hypothetical protein